MSMIASISLVAATADDIPFLLSLRMATTVEHLEAMGLFLSESEHLERIRFHLDHAYLVVGESGAVGMLKFVESETEIEIVQLQILPAIQGQGVGSSLIRMLASRRKKMVLSVLKNNPARQLYERMGFHATDEDEHQLRMQFDAPDHSG